MGSKADNSFLGVEYSEKIVNIFNDKNYTYTANHPQMDGVMYWDKHVQPSNDPCLGNILETGYGSIDAEYLFRVVGGVHKTGDGQVCSFDFENLEVWLAYSYGTDVNAYTRSPMRIRFAPLFNATSATSKGVY